MKKLLFICFFLLTLSAFTIENWPQFRGIQSKGLASITKPITMPEKLWSIDLKGSGSSSPVIWGEKLFITAQTQNGLCLVAININDGKMIWKQELLSGDYHTHKFNNAAASTPCITDSYIILPWYNAKEAKAILTCFNHQGHKVWETKLGPFKSKHGYTANPVVKGNTIITTLLHQGESFIAAYNLKTGSQIWKFPSPSGDVSYATPLVRTNKNGHEEVVVIGGSLGAIGLDLKTGKENWSVKKSFDNRTVNSPIEVKVDNKSYICASQKGKDFYAIEVPNSSESKANIFWQQRKIGAYVPSLISHNKTLTFLQDNGILTSYNFSSKKEVSKVKLSSNFYSSPIMANNLLYCLSRSGKLFILQAEPSLKILNSIDLKPPEDSDWIDSTPAIASDKIFIRLGSRLDCYK